MDKLKSRRYAWLIPVALVMASPAPAEAHGGNSDPSVIHACVQNTSGNTKVVGVNGSCANNETPVHWSIIGPRGEQGEPGPPGATGPQGLDGVVPQDVLDRLSALETAFAALPKLETIVTSPIQNIPERIDLLSNQAVEGGQHFIVGPVNTDFSLVVFHSSVVGLLSDSCKPYVIQAWPDLNGNYTHYFNQSYLPATLTGYPGTGSVMVDFFGTCSSETPIVSAWLEIVP